MTAAALALALALAAPGAVPIRHPPGTLHGFPSLSDRAGNVIADGELAQTLRGRTLHVRLRWAFRDGRTAVEEDEFELGAHLIQRRFSWVETKAGLEVRRFEADLVARKASATRRHDDGKIDRDEADLDLPAGGAFAGYGTALAVSQLRLGPGAEVELGFVAFGPKPRVVTLGVKRDREEAVAAHGRSIPCDRFTLHAKLPFPISLAVHPKDAVLWFTHEGPPALVRAQQTLVTKDDPEVVVDVIPRGPIRGPEARRAPTPAARRGGDSRGASPPSTP
jgi:hypothetical protein